MNRYKEINQYLLKIVRVVTRQPNLTMEDVEREGMNMDVRRLDELPNRIEETTYWDDCVGSAVD